MSCNVASDDKLLESNQELELKKYSELDFKNFKNSKINPIILNNKNIKNKKNHVGRLRIKKVRKQSADNLEKY